MVPPDPVAWIEWGNGPHHLALAPACATQIRIRRDLWVGACMRHGSTVHGFVDDRILHIDKD